METVVTKAGDGSHMKTIGKKGAPGALHLWKPLKVMMVLDPKRMKSLSRNVATISINFV